MKNGRDAEEWLLRVITCGSYAAVLAALALLWYALASLPIDFIKQQLAIARSVY
jgi:hypothetical protein